MKSFDYASRVDLLGFAGRRMLAVAAKYAMECVDNGHGDPVFSSKGRVVAVQLIAPAVDDSSRPSRRHGLGLGGSRYVYAQRVAGIGRRQGLVYSFDMNKIESGIRPPEDASDEVKAALAAAPFVRVLNECAV
jgi:hypothetical protein